MSRPVGLESRSAARSMRSTAPRHSRRRAPSGAHAARAAARAAERFHALHDGREERIALQVQAAPVGAGERLEVGERAPALGDEAAGLPALRAKSRPGEQLAPCRPARRRAARRIRAAAGRRASGPRAADARARAAPCVRAPAARAATPRRSSPSAAGTPTRRPTAAPKQNRRAAPHEHVAAPALEVLQRRPRVRRVRALRATRPGNARRAPGPATVRRALGVAREVERRLDGARLLGARPLLDRLRAARRVAREEKRELLVRRRARPARPRRARRSAASAAARSPRRSWMSARELGRRRQGRVELLGEREVLERPRVVVRAGVDARLLPLVERGGSARAGRGRGGARSRRRGRRGLRPQHELRRAGARTPPSPRASPSRATRRAASAPRSRSPHCAHRSADWRRRGLRSGRSAAARSKSRRASSFAARSGVSQRSCASGTQSLRSGRAPTRAPAGRRRSPARCGPRALRAPASASAASA